MSFKLNFITTCGGPYPMEYANKAHSMLARNLDIPFESYCITERPYELSDDITPIAPLIDDVRGWWNKLFLFSNKMPDGYILFLDVDLVLVDNITDVINYAYENLEQIACYSDAIHWEGSKFSSSMMFFRSGELHHIYENFLQSYPAINNFLGGDQVWTFPQLDKILYLDEVFPGFKNSLKFQLGTNKEGSLTVPKRLPKGLRLIDFHGDPKPHQLLDWSVIKENWR